MNEGDNEKKRKSEGERDKNQRYIDMRQPTRKREATSKKLGVREGVRE